MQVERSRAAWFAQKSRDGRRVLCRHSPTRVRGALFATAPPYVAIAPRSRLGGVPPVEGTGPGHRHAVLSEQSNGGSRAATRISSRPQSESTARPRRSFHNTLLFYWRKREHGHGPPQPGSGRGTRPRGVASTRATGSASSRVQAPASSPASSPNSDSSLHPSSGPASAPELTARALGSCGRALAAARALAWRPI